jgi:hypothetical protein
MTPHVPPAPTRPLALKQCPDCGATCPDSRKQCLSCGHKF